MASRQDGKDQGRHYVAIDLKSFYASVECVERGLNPLTTNLVVADASRTEKTICLAVSPSLKAYGISGRARLFEVVQRVAEVNRDRLYHSPLGIMTGRSTHDPDLQAHPDWEVDYITAPPRMAFYLDYSARIYRVYLRYIAPEDIHVYSIDEVIMDVTRYLHTYHTTPHELAMRMVRDVLRETGITATAGIGTNMYLSKVAMDIVAKHMPADADGVRIAELDEMSYRHRLWNHKPLTDFWRVGRGIARKLVAHGMNTMGDVARCSLQDEELLYRLFGVNAELLIDHAWGWEPCRMEDVKSYRPQVNSLSSGQVLTEPYTWDKARVVAREMADSVALDLVDKGLVADQLTLTVGYDVKQSSEMGVGSGEWRVGSGGHIDQSSEPGVRSSEIITHHPSLTTHHSPLTTDYSDLDIVTDWYGRRVPRPAHGSIHLPQPTASSRLICDAIVSLYDRIVDPRLLVRRLTIGTYHVVPEDKVRPAESSRQLNLFVDPEAETRRHEAEAAALARERRMQETMLAIRKRFGKNALLRGTDFEEGATARQRHRQIGGHKA